MQCPEPSTVARRLVFLLSALFAVVFVTALPGCGADVQNADETAGQDGDGNGKPKPGAGGDGTSTGGPSGGSREDQAPVRPNTALVGAKFGTYISLGDSISAFIGEGPFFNNLLFQNDDEAYPEWKGKDLSTRYPGIKYVKGARGGAQTGRHADQANARIPILEQQVTALERDYPGDVLVTITIGGNDLNAHAFDAARGQDQGFIDAMKGFLKQNLDELLTPGRLGKGQVFIVEANIYDASDGEGNWRSGGNCGPRIDIGREFNAPAFERWNGAIADIVKSYGEKNTLFDLHALFAGKGFNGEDFWFARDCIHANKKGNQAMRERIWQIVTGEKG
jgi:lysophospholipase L1-like esterase